MKTSGIFSPSGGMPFLAVLLFLVWILLASVLLVQRTSEAAAPRAATVM
jgi:hypothetical protein